MNIREVLLNDTRIETLPTSSGEWIAEVYGTYEVLYASRPYQGQSLAKADAQAWIDSSDTWTEVAKTPLHYVGRPTAWLRVYRAPEGYYSISETREGRSLILRLDDDAAREAYYGATYKILPPEGVLEGIR